MLDRKKIILPEWTKSLPNSTKMNCKEVLSFFGHKSTRSVGDMVARGQLPKHDFSCTKANKTYKNFWSLGILRSLEIEQNKENK